MILFTAPIISTEAMIDTLMILIEIVLKVICLQNFRSSGSIDLARGWSRGSPSGQQKATGSARPSASSQETCSITMMINERFFATPLETND